MTDKALEAAARVIARDLGGDNYDADDWGVFASTAEKAISAYLSALPGEAEVVSFETWWSHEGRFIDPDTSDVPWFDKREAFAEEAFNASLTSLQAMQARAEKAERERDEWKLIADLSAWADGLDNPAHPYVNTIISRAEAAEARVKEMEEALTPSAETKAAYMGEFSFKEEIFDGETDTYTTVDRSVPWTTIKEIMTAIRARTALKGGSNG